MIYVNNKKVVSNLSNKSLKANKQRNIVAIIAIAMTAVLFTALFTVGGSMMASIQRATMYQVGTSSHAGFKYLTQGQYDVLKEDPKIKDISYNIIVGFGENEELKKTYTEIRWTEAKDAEWSFNTPTTGKLPEKGFELATTTAVLDALGVPHQLGETVNLEFTANGTKYSQDFVLCGFWDTNAAMNANEAFVSREYADKVAPVITVPLYEGENGEYTSDYYSGTINPSFWFATSWDIEGQVNNLMQRCGFDPQYVNEGVNWAYTSSSVDVQTLILVAAIVCLILLSGYLIIYNIFYISVSKDIRFYGLLKTIGTTGKQLKKIVRRQAMSLCTIGIPLGLIIGWVCGRFLTPIIISSTTLGDKFIISWNPYIFVFATIFSLLTVYISCIKPSHIASKVSPIEAVRWTGVKDSWSSKLIKSKRVTPTTMAISGLKRDRKRASMVVLSLALSMVLLNCTYTIISGFDMDKYISGSVVTDFLISDVSLRSPFSTYNNIEGVTPTVLEQINELPGLESSGSVWMRENTHKLSNEAYAKANDIIERNRDQMQMPYAEGSLNMLEEDQSIATHIFGIDESLWDKIELYSDKKIDKDKFASGDYVIVSAFRNKENERYYNVGDKIELDFGDGKTKTYTVLEVGDIPYALGPQHGHYIDLSVILPSSEYVTNIPGTQPMVVGFYVDDENTQNAEEWIKNYCKNVETDLDYESKGLYVEKFKDNQVMFGVVGGLLSFILGLIGVLNFINSTITSIISRMRELAMLQSVGMTSKQLKRMLVGEGLIYALLTVAFTVTIGNLISYGIVKLITGQIWFFSYHFTLLPIIICIPFLILISVLIPIIGCNSLSKQSIVERLRGYE